MEQEPNILEQIMKVNGDLAERLSEGTLKVSYDPEFDIFMLTIGEPIKAITEQINDGFQVRVEPDTLRISAFEIMGFRKKYLPNHPDLLPYFAMLFETPPVQRREITGARQGRERAAARNLVPAI